MTLVVWALVSLPYVLPLGQAWLESHQEFVLFPSLLALVVIACFTGIRRLEPQERQFWALVGAGFAVWLISYVPYYAVSPDRRHLALDLSDDLFYLAYYLCLLLALDVRPHLATASPFADRERWLKSLGTALLAFAGLGYFALIPAAVNPQDYATWVPSYSLYLALDALLVTRLGVMTARAGSPRWRLLYGALGVSAALMLAVDALELLDRIGLARFDTGTPTDLLWTLPLVAFAWSARLRDRIADEMATVPSLEAFDSSPLRTGSFLLLCALALPATHFALYLGGLLDPSTHTLREAVALGALVSLGAIAAIAYRTLDRERLSLRRRQRRLELRLRRVERAQMVGRLAEGLTHDFGNLLQIIGGRTDPLLTRVPADSPLREDLEAIRDASRRMVQLAAQIVDLVQTEFDEPQLVRLSDVARGLEPLLRSIAGDQVTVEVRVRASRDVVRIDVRQVERILLALAANAREAMPRKGSLTIEVFDLDVTPRLEAQLGLVAGPYAALSVTDTGSGMSEETRERAFEPFFTTRSEVEHTGLGLTSALHAASHYGGTVQIDSALGRGATVTLYLPRADAKVVDMAPGSIEDTLRTRRIAPRLAGDA